VKPTDAQHRVLLNRAHFAAFLNRVATIQTPRRPIKKHRACLCGHLRPNGEKEFKR
jgi:hypothetical protein